MSPRSAGPLFWENLKTTEFSATDMAGRIAVLPVSAVEQHGPHLPLAVDAIINAGILEAALGKTAAESPVLVLPAQTVGMSEEHNRFPGTLSLSAETLIAMWTEIGAAIARAGVRKLVIFNSHGGNPPVMDIVARRLRGRYSMLVVKANWWNVAEIDDLFDDGEHRHGIHGGAVETSLMLHLRPDLVDMTKAQDFKSLGAMMARDFERLSPTAAPAFAWETQDLNETGAVGNACAADATLGALILERAAAGLNTLLQDVEKFDPAILKSEISGQES
jgi:creatinine amidohydrolase